MHDIAQKQIFFLTTRAESGSGFGGELSGSGSGKKVRIRPDPYSNPQHCESSMYLLPHSRQPREAPSSRSSCSGSWGSPPAQPPSWPPGSPPGKNAQLKTSAVVQKHRAGVMSALNGYGSTDLQLDTSTEIKKKHLTNRSINPYKKRKMSL